MNREDYFSSRAHGMKRSVIRELLKLTAKPGVISFAGGLPAPKTFPVPAVRAAIDEVMDREWEKALQYGPTEGDVRLREDLVAWMRQDGIEADVDNVMITTASQQGLDLIGKVFLDPGDTCVVGLPTYLGGIQAFKSYQGVPVGVELDDEGMIPDSLEEILSRLESEERRPRFIYIVPDFQNPAGVTLPEARRKRIIEIARRGEYIIVEDTPYRQLRYSGSHQRTFQQLAPDMVLSLYTFSKILLPGFRLGWALGPDWIIDKMVMAKQAVDLCTPPFNQAITHAMLVEGALQKGLKQTIALYSGRRNLMLECLDAEVDTIPGAHYTRPEGGLFLWLTLPEGMDSDELFVKAVKENVAYVPGSAFFPDGEDTRSMRLNFSYAEEEQIREGVKRLAGVIREHI